MKGFIEMYTGHAQSPANLPATTGPDLWADGAPPREGLPPRGAPPPRPLPPPLPRGAGGWPRGGAARGGIAMV